MYLTPHPTYCVAMTTSTLHLLLTILLGSCLVLTTEASLVTDRQARDASLEQDFSRQRDRDEVVEAVHTRQKRQGECLRVSTIHVQLTHWQLQPMLGKFVYIRFGGVIWLLFFTNNYLCHVDHYWLNLCHLCHNIANCNIYIVSKLLFSGYFA